MDTPPLGRVAARGRRELTRLRGKIASTRRRMLREQLGRATASTVIVTEYPAPAGVRWGWGRAPLAALDEMFAGDRDEYRRLLERFEPRLGALRAIPRRSIDPREARWENEFFAGMDAVALYHFFDERRPARYMEIGSGHSTRFARRAIDDFRLDTTITSIDPSPRAEIDDLCDTVHRVGLQYVSLDVFDQLRAGDILLLDGSHVVHMDSDVTVAFTELLPRVPPGVLVGIDDIFLPWDYPEPWVERWYGEQYLLAVLLLSGDPSWRVIFPAWWASKDPELAQLIARFEDPARAVSGTIGKTFWMERRSS
jgi:hypothetical protein